jgi:hypothetical protein
MRAVQPGGFLFKQNSLNGSATYCNRFAAFNIFRT